jgi:hypothetical protein
MQEEVTKHTRKIYRTMRKQKHSTAEKIKEILIEICIIVFAVTLSIWLHGWSEHRHQQQEVREFLNGLKADLQKDIETLETSKGVISRLDSSYHFLASASDNRTAINLLDTTLSPYLYFDLWITNVNTGRYEGFKSSGKIGSIENDTLKANILAYFQQMVPRLVFAENYVNALQQKILDQVVDKNEQTRLMEFISTNKMRSLLSLGMHNFEVNIGEYETAIKQAKEIVAGIEKE